MGNKPSNPKPSNPKPVSIGFFGSVTAAVWRPRHQAAAAAASKTEQQTKHSFKRENTIRARKPNQETNKGQEKDSKKSDKKEDTVPAPKPEQETNNNDKKENNIPAPKPEEEANGSDKKEDVDNNIDNSDKEDIDNNSDSSDNEDIDDNNDNSDNEDIDDNTDNGDKEDIDDNNDNGDKEDIDNNTNNSDKKEDIGSSSSMKMEIEITASDSPCTPPAPINDADEQDKSTGSGKHVVEEDSDASSDKSAGGAKSMSCKLRRVASAGLQVGSVLQRNMENIKEKYDIGKKLGQGQFGTTYLCLEKGTGREFACKTIAKRKLTTPEDVEDVRKEIQIMHHLEGHPNIVTIVGAFEDAVAIHLVMELCAGGELFDRIVQRGHYSERKAAELTRVIVGVVQACHSMGVMHRDLKPENFLFVDDEEESLLKTIDFGLSVFFKPGEIFRDVVGSPYYVAPEVLNKLYGPECDVWSAGVILYILLCGTPPFWDETEDGIFEQVLNGVLDFESEPWPSISDDAKDLVKKMLVREPEMRLTAHEVLCHPWAQVDGVAPDKPLDSAVLSRLKQFSAMNKLKKMAIRIIAERLSEEEIAGLTEMFKMIDVDDSGHITLEELKTGLERVGTNLNDSEIVDLMHAADVDNSGTIDYGEFLAAMLHLNKIQREDHMFAAFTFFDKDGSGYITKDELQQACEQFGLGDVHLDEIIDEIDKDNDGRIDYHEFTDMMQDTGFGIRD